MLEIQKVPKGKRERRDTMAVFNKKTKTPTEINT